RAPSALPSFSPYPPFPPYRAGLTAEVGAWPVTSAAQALRALIVFQSGLGDSRGGTASGPHTAECYTYEEENVDQVLDISPEQLAYLALRAILDRIHAGRDLNGRPSFGSITKIAPALASGLPGFAGR